MHNERRTLKIKILLRVLKHRLHIITDVIIERDLLARVSFIIIIIIISFHWYYYHYDDYD